MLACEASLVSSFLLGPLLHRCTPNSWSRTQAESCLWSAEMRMALLGLNIRELDLVAFAQLLLPERPFPAVSLAGLVVQV